MNSSKIGLLFLFLMVLTMSEIINVTELSGKQSIIFNQTTGLLTIFPAENSSPGPSIGAGINLPFLQTLASTYGFYSNYPGFYSVQAPRFWIMKNPPKNQSKGNTSSTSPASKETVGGSSAAKSQVKQSAPSGDGKLLDFAKGQNNNTVVIPKQQQKKSQQKQQKKASTETPKVQTTTVTGAETKQKNGEVTSPIQKKQDTASAKADQTNKPVVATVAEGATVTVQVKKQKSNEAAPASQQKKEVEAVPVVQNKKQEPKAAVVASEPTAVAKQKNNQTTLVGQVLQKKQQGDSSHVTVATKAAETTSTPAATQQKSSETTPAAQKKQETISVSASSDSKTLDVGTKQETKIETSNAEIKKQALPGDGRIDIPITKQTLVVGQDLRLPQTPKPVALPQGTQQNLVAPLGAEKTANNPQAAAVIP